jgi:uncharacterized repeat protein (TIGR01451 family)
MSKRPTRNGLLLVILIACSFLASMAGSAAASSLFLCSEHHSAVFDAWNVFPDGTVAKVATYSTTCAHHPAGITIDNTYDTAAGESPSLLITSEFDPGIEIVDPTTLTYYGCAPGPTDLAGVDVDDIDDVVYSVERATDRLYIYALDAVTKDLSQLAIVNLPSCTGAMGLAVDELRKLLWVADSWGGMVRAYDIDVGGSWDTIAEIPHLSFVPCHVPIDVAVDRARDCIYTTSMYGGAYLPSGSGSTLLSRREILDYGTGAAVDTCSGIVTPGVGVAVDEPTGYVYVTHGAYYGDNLTVWDTATDPFTNVQTTAPIGNPAGICIGQYNPVNLAKNDTVQGYGVYIGQTFTYEMTFDNPLSIDVTGVTLLDTLPAELDYVVCTHGGVYDPVTHTLLWDIGTVAAGTSVGPIQLVVKVNYTAEPGCTCCNYCTIDGDQIPPTTVIGCDLDAPPDAPTGTFFLPSIPVEIDIKPWSCPNSINLGSRGLVPVAILSSEDFDATTVDPGTVLLAGAGVVFKGNKYMAHIEDADCDGDLDLVCQVAAQHVDPGLFVMGLAPLTGMADGTPIDGWDSVNIVPKDD